MKWDGWRGNLEGRPSFWFRDLFERWGLRATIHKFVGADDPGCYHTHPAYAVRVILWGGYTEEMPDGSQKRWQAGMVGIVAPELAHRIAALHNDATYTLWLRAPKRTKIRLVGPGWPPHLATPLEAVRDPRPRS